MIFDLPALAEWLGRASLQASVVVVLVLVINTIFRATLPRRWSYLLWMIVVARLVLPIGPATPFSVYNLGHFMAPEPEAAVVEEPQGVWLPESVAMAMPGFAPAEPLVAEPAAPAPTPIPWFEIAAVVWLAGVVLLVAGRIRAALRFRVKLRHARPVKDARVLRTLALSSRTMGVRRSVPLLESDAVSSPALVGLRNPRLVMPAGLAEGLRRSELKLIFQHELVHLKRKDLVANALLFVLRTMHWFNPLIWIAVARCRTDQELACDEAVLSVVRPSQRARYGLTILKVIERMAAPRALPGTVALLQGKQEIERRIDMIARYRTQSKVASVLGFALFLGLGCVALSSAMPTEAAVCPPGEEKEAIVVRKVSDGEGPRVIVIKSGDEVRTIDLSELGGGVTVIDLDEEGKKSGSGDGVVRLRGLGSGDGPKVVKRLQLDSGDGPKVLERFDVEAGKKPYFLQSISPDVDVQKIVKRLKVDSGDGAVYEWVEGDGPSKGNFTFDVDVRKDEGFSKKSKNVQRIRLGKEGDGNGFVFKSDDHGGFVFGKADSGDGSSDDDMHVYSWRSDDGAKIELRVEARTDGKSAPKGKVIRKHVSPKSGDGEKRFPFDVDVDVKVFGIDEDGKAKNFWRSIGDDHDGPGMTWRSKGDAKGTIYFDGGEADHEGNVFFYGGKGDDDGESKKGNIFFHRDGDVDFGEILGSGDVKFDYFFDGDGDFDVKKLIDGKGKGNVHVYGFKSDGEGGNYFFGPGDDSDAKGRFEVILDAEGKNPFGTWFTPKTEDGDGGEKKSPFGTLKDGEVQAHGYTIRLDSESGEPLKRFFSTDGAGKGGEGVRTWLELLDGGEGGKTMRYRVDANGNIERVEAVPGSKNDSKEQGSSKGDAKSQKSRRDVRIL